MSDYMNIDMIRADLDSELHFLEERLEAEMQMNWEEYREYLTHELAKRDQS